MAGVTSGTYNSTLVTLSRDEVITDAMQDIRQLSAAGAPSANDLIAGTRRLNRLLKRWETMGFLLWLYDLVQVPLVQNQYIYSIGPGGDVDPGYRMLRVLEGSFIRTTCAPTPQDTNLIIWSRVEYLQTSYKPSLGIPNSIYYDVQMAGKVYNPTVYDPAQGQGVLYVFPAPADSTRTIFLNTQRPMQDITGATQSFDLPTEWYDALVKCLGASMADLFEVPEDRMQRIKREASEMEDYIANWGSQEWASMTFQPDYQFGFRGAR